MAQEKTLTELIDSYTWYDKKNKAQEIFRRLQAGLGGQITTQEDGVNVNENTTLLNFTGGGVNLTDLGEGSVEINIESSGSSPQNLQSVTDVGNTTTNSIILQSTLYDGTYNNSFINFTQKLSQGGGTIISPLILTRDLNSNVYSLQRKQEANTTQGFGFGSGTNWDFYINRLTGSVEFNKYGLGNITGTPVYNLGIDANGKVVETPLIESGDFIPLSGTEVGSPVIGDIEIIDSNILIKNPASTFSSTFAFDEILFSNSNGISIAKDISLSRKNVGQSYLELDITESNPEGIRGSAYYGANYTDNTYVQKKYVDDSLTNLSPIETANTGTVISLTTSGGNLCNFGSANANTTYTTTGTVLNAYAKVLINTTSEPIVLSGTVETAGSFVIGETYQITTVGTTDYTLIGASANTVGVNFTATGVGAGTGTATLAKKKIAGATWVTGTDMYMVVNYTGAARGVEYYFLEI